VPCGPTSAPVASGAEPSDVGDFDPKRYWEKRLEGTFSLGGVGWLGLGEPFNRWMYRVRRRVFARTVRKAATQLGDARVLDVGSGTGFYIERWRELGVRDITGIDLTDVAVQQLSGRYPDGRFIQADITDGTGDLPAGHFDAISIMDVLFHVVDDDRYGRAIANLHSLLRPGGVLILTENLLHGSWHRGEHQVSRDADWILGLLDDSGFDVLTRRPLFVLMNTPVDSRSRLLKGWWWLLMNVMARARWLGGPLGAAIYPAETALTATLREGPTTEIVAARKRPA
jgi:SAM-dependent methyltransferase